MDSQPKVACKPFLMEVKYSFQNKNSVLREVNQHLLVNLCAVSSLYHFVIYTNEMKCRSFYLNKISYVRIHSNIFLLIKDTNIMKIR